MIERVVARASSLGEGLPILRVLPVRGRRMIGAWCFLDQIGPITFGPGAGMHVGAHPHTALQTSTWMIEGEIRHRDSLGNDQLICPGQVNLMTAGRGVVHTEDSATPGQRLHAAQLWIALPPQEADRAAAFEHHPELPRWTQAGCTFTLLAGAWAGHRAPTRVYSPLVGLDLLCPQGGVLSLPLQADFEYGLLALEGAIEVAGEAFGHGELAYLAPGRTALDLRCQPGSRVLLIGGVPFEAPIVMWWNFVGFSREAVIQAQTEWSAGTDRFGAVPGDGGRRLPAPPLPWSS